MGIGAINRGYVSAGRSALGRAGPEERSARARLHTIFTQKRLPTGFPPVMDVDLTRRCALRDSAQEWVSGEAEEPISVECSGCSFLTDPDLRKDVDIYMNNTVSQ